MWASGRLGRRDGHSLGRNAALEGSILWGLLWRVGIHQNCDAIVRCITGRSHVVFWRCICDFLLSTESLNSPPQALAFPQQLYRSSPASCQSLKDQIQIVVVEIEHADHTHTVHFYVFVRTWCCCRSLIYESRHKSSHKKQTCSNWLDKAYAVCWPLKSLINFLYDFTQIEQLWSNIPLLVDVKWTPGAEQSCG